MATKTTDKPGMIGQRGKSRHGLEGQGLDPRGTVHWNLSPAAAGLGGQDRRWVAPGVGATATPAASSAA